MKSALWLLALLLLTGGASARAEAPAKTPQAAFLDGERRIAFEMRKKPWHEVIEWLVDQTGLNYISNQAPPTGSFNFISPRGATFSGPEVIDIINDGLLQHQYVLIRRPRSFTILPADQKIDPANIARIPIADLPKRGTTEIVQILATLQGLDAAEYAADVKRQLGPLGSVAALPIANQLILQDTAHNLSRILETIDGIERSKNDLATFAHKCVYVKAHTAEQILRDLLGEAAPIEGGRGLANPALDKAAAKGAGGPRSPSFSSIRADDRTNTLFVNARPNTIAQAKSYLAKIDQPQHPGQQPVLIGMPEFVPYDVPAGNAEFLVKTLSETPAFRPTQAFRMFAVSPTRVLVYGGPEEQRQFDKVLKTQAPPSPVTETIPLALLDAPRVAASLRTMLGDAANGAPYIEGDSSRNTIVVHGSKEQVRHVKNMIQALGENPEVARRLNVIQLEKGQAVPIAEAIRRLLPNYMRNPDVRIIVPGRLELPLYQPEPRPRPD